MEDNSSDYVMENNSTDYVSFADTLLLLITDDVRSIFQLTNYVIICGVISFFGVGANAINICVFVNQGFKDSINISLMGLAISDLVSSVSLFWTSICYNPLTYSLDLPVDLHDLMYYTAGWPHVCFNRITSFITAFITLERCLCIAMPLKVKTIITPFRTKVIVFGISLVMIIFFASLFFVHNLEFRFNVSRNRSILVLTYTESRQVVDSVVFFIHSVVLSSVFLISVIICTIILVVKLNKKSKWRQMSVMQISSTLEATSVKEKKVVKMITLISAIFIVCYVPPTVIFLLMVFYQEFTFNGKYENLFDVTWSVVYILDAVNSSVNIFVYFNMSSKFKMTFREKLCAFPKEYYSMAK